MSDDEVQTIRSNERSYFAIIPHMADDDLTMAEYRLYGHYRRICGEKNYECRETTGVTAAKIGIGRSTVSSVRQSLADKGYVYLAYVKVRNTTRLYVTLADIWPQNMARYAPDPKATVPPQERYRPATRTLASRHKNVSVPLQERHIGIQELKEEELVKEELTPSFRRSEQANERTNEFSFPSEEIEQSFKILTDPAIRMSNKKAQVIAAAYPFLDIRAFCCDFVAQNKQADREAGLIAHWLEARETVPPLIYNELWERHHAADEKKASLYMNNGYAETAEPDDNKPETAPIPADAEDSDLTPAAIWHLTVSDLSLSLPTPTFETWVRGTTAIGWQDGTFVVGVPHTYARDWLQNRLRPQAERSLSRHLGRNAKVTFVVDPRPNQSKETR